MIETALRYELENAIPALKGEIYPTNAPESSKKPYLVYYRLRTGRIKTLEGYTNSREFRFMFSIMAARYEDMKTLTGQVESLLLSLCGRTIGQDGALSVEDLTIHNIEEVYEVNLKVNRGILDFTIYY